ncbi:hypothetical protein FNV43_RR01431 [Rhamnella rubrinervis]|uniref:Uncharacterized protein n=1 Tax=Rhamnella rubrinervis TaxID=2594499 RepID=A0A8K0HPT5_9ROSA|nr:hypothetical protein FNV43_RR01431 [Rhamnella rubrinervis]
MHPQRYTNYFFPTLSPQPHFHQHALAFLCLLPAPQRARRCVWPQSSYKEPAGHDSSSGGGGGRVGANNGHDEKWKKFRREALPRHLSRTKLILCQAPPRHQWRV